MQPAKVRRPAGGRRGRTAAARCHAACSGLRSRASHPADAPAPDSPFLLSARHSTYWLSTFPSVSAHARDGRRRGAAASTVCRRAFLLPRLARAWGLRAIGDTVESGLGSLHASQSALLSQHAVIVFRRALSALSPGVSCCYSTQLPSPRLLSLPARQNSPRTSTRVHRVLLEWHVRNFSQAGCACGCVAAGTAVLSSFLPPVHPSLLPVSLHSHTDGIVRTGAMRTAWHAVTDGRRAEPTGWAEA